MNKIDLYKRCIICINRLQTICLQSMISIMYRKKSRKMARNFPLVSNEIEWQMKWRIIQKKPDINSYRYYANYIGPNIDIVTDEIIRNYILPILNPSFLRSFYNDKNMFDKIFGHVLPKTLLRRIRGLYYDSEYNVLLKDNLNLIDCLVGHDRIIIKPSIETSGGQGVVLFEFVGGKYIQYSTSEELNIDWLENRFGSDFIIQDAIKQSSYMEQFNEKSVNTLRMHVYRSVRTGEPHVIGTVLKIGVSGSVVDNVVSGGGFVGVNHLGILDKKVFTRNNEAVECFNKIDFFVNTFQIPNYDKICSFAKGVSKNVPYHHSHAMDIALDENNNPVLIEVNYRSMGIDLYQQTSTPVFGKFTDEVIDYCAAHKKDILFVNTELF